ncbi:MAG: hypothetical protein ACRDWY_14355 [Actinomycetes bacterium]
MTRRDNGLHAPSYDRLVDVETHLVEGLLERLRDEDVAAYSAPTGGRPGPYGDTVLPVGPSDSVWVDSTRRAEARAVTDQYLEEVAADLAWAGIVADFERDSADEVPTWPASEDVDENIDRDPDADAGEHPGRGSAGSDGRTSGFDELRDVVASPLADDHFEPPPPPPLPSVDPLTRIAWVGALGGPAALVLAALGGVPLSGWVGFLALLAGMAGFVTLVARMKDRPPTDSGPDDGAVV